MIHAVRGEHPVALVLPHGREKASTFHAVVAPHKLSCLGPIGAYLRTHSQSPLLAVNNLEPGLKENVSVSPLDSNNHIDPLVIDCVV